MSHLKMVILLCSILALPVHAVQNWDRVVKVGPYHFSEPVSQCMEITPHRSNSELVQVKNKCNFNIVVGYCLLGLAPKDNCLTEHGGFVYANSDDFTAILAPNNGDTMYFIMSNTIRDGRTFTNEEKARYPKVKFNGACALPPGYDTVRLGRFINKTTGEYESTTGYVCHLVNKGEIGEVTSRLQGGQDLIRFAFNKSKYCYPTSYKGRVTDLMQPCSR